MSVSVYDVLNDSSSTALDERDGKYIAPQAIEVTFKAVCPIVSAMLVHADGRNYATALVTLDAEALDQWGRAQGLPGTAYAALAADPAVRSCVDVLNGRLNPGGDDPGVPDPRPRPDRRRRRADPQPVGPAQGDRARYRALLDSMYAGQRHG